MSADIPAYQKLTILFLRGSERIGSAGLMSLFVFSLWCGAPAVLGPIYPLAIALLAVLISTSSGPSTPKIYYSFIAVNVFFGICDYIPVSISLLVLFVCLAQHEKRAGPLALAATLGLMSFSFVSTVESYLISNLFPWFGICSKPVVAVTLLSLLMAAAKKSGRPAFFGVFFVICCGGVASMQYTLGVNPGVAQVASAISILPGFLFLYYFDANFKFARLKICCALMLSLFMATWIFSPPSSLATLSKIFVWSQEGSSDPGAKFFEHLSDSLSWSGLKSEQIFRLSDAPDKSLTIVPTGYGTITSSEPAAGLAHIDSPSILVLGEHDDFGSIASWVSRLNLGIKFRSDLLVPYLNRDSLGAQTANSIIAVPHDLYMNRGASISVDSFRSRVITVADGTFSKKVPLISGWTGDYHLHYGDLAGRAPTIVSVKQERQWTLVADNSPFVTQQLLTDPTDALRIVWLSTLWPTLLNDIAVLLVVLLLLGFHTWSELKFRSFLFTLTILISIPNFIFDQISNKLTHEDRSMVPPPGGSVDSFSLKTKEMILQLRRENAKLFRWDGELSMKELGKTAGPEVHFGFVRPSYAFGDIAVGRCSRFGRVRIREPQGSEVELMDAQACAVNVDADLILGESEECIGFRIAVGKRKVCIILDRRFLSKTAPNENQEFVRKLLPSCL